MTRATDAVGAYGERVAARLLTQAGMLVLDRNWRRAAGELDIVASDGPVVIFCEVKTRRGGGCGSPAEAVNRSKVNRLRRLAAQWLAEHPEVRGPVRFDVVSVWPQRRGAAATH
jgi:putative endonuclease